MNKKLLWINAILFVASAVVLAACGGGVSEERAIAATPTPANQIIIPDTGQTACYNTQGVAIPCTNSGQDGAYSNHPMDFTDNHDGTITDKVTGLLWQKCTNGLSGEYCITGTALQCNWYQASGTYDVNYNPTGTNVCGSGWRLPTVFELMTIVDYGTYSPAINATFFPETRLYSYWTSTSYAQAPSANAWAVNFGSGNVNDGDSGKRDSLYVRCVR